MKLIIGICTYNRNVSLVRCLKSINKLFSVRNVKIKIMPGLLVFIILTPLLIIMFWPYLWENPLINFIAAFKSFSSIPWDWFNLYIGKLKFFVSDIL